MLTGRLRVLVVSPRDTAVVDQAVVPVVSRGANAIPLDDGRTALYDRYGPLTGWMTFQAPVP
jgi:hypothetical protein